jgi:hypothetical protein
MYPDKTSFYNKLLNLPPTPPSKSFTTFPKNIFYTPYKPLIHILTSLLAYTCVFERKIAAKLIILFINKQKKVKKNFIII